MKYISLLLFIVIPSNLFGQSGTKNGAFEAKKLAQLSILIDAGMKISITGVDGDQITYDFEFDGNDQAYEHIFKNFDPVYEQIDGQASIMIEFPQQTRKNVNYRIKKSNLTINVPKDIELQLDTRYSKIEISSIARVTKVNNRSGSVKLRNIGQGAFIRNEYGDCDVESINGDVDITSRSSTIDAKNIRGNLIVNSDYSKLNLTKISGRLRLENKSGTVNAYDLDSDFISRGDYTKYELTDIRGNIQIENKSGTINIDKAENVSIRGDYTNINARDLNGEQIVIESKSANIKLENLLGEVIINGSYLDIGLINIAREVSVTNRSGKINAKELKSSFLIDGDYNTVKLDRFLGDKVNIQNRSGDIEINAINKLTHLVIESSYTSVDLNLAAPFEGKVSFDVTYGSLEQPFKLDNATFTDEKNSKIIKGSVGNGNGLLSIKSRNGDIRITNN